jgi:hypothetical protein
MNESENNAPNAFHSSSDRPGNDVLGHVPLRAADARRSVRNILQWNSYLPANCVRSMVRMGWDYTT